MDLRYAVLWLMVAMGVYLILLNEHMRSFNVRLNALEEAPSPLSLTEQILALPGADLLRIYEKLQEVNWAAR